MKRGVKIPLIIAAAAFVLGYLGLTAAAQKGPLPPVSTQIKPLCCDLRAELSIVKGSTGLVQLNAKICNDGPGKYNNPTSPLDAFFMVYTWHPPKTIAQEQDVKFYGHTNLGTQLASKQCKPFSYAYQIEKFSRWGHFPNSSTERKACKQFVAKVELQNGSGFTKCQDTKMENDVAVILEVPYMEKIN